LTISFGTSRIRLALHFLGNVVAFEVKDGKHADFDGLNSVKDAVGKAP
jgi:hypothetical protein